jgi:ATP-binding cassette subfamily B protein
VTVLIRAVAGAISIGMLTFLAASFRQSRDLLQQLLMSASGIYEQSLYLRDLFVFFDMKPTIFSVPARPVPRPIQTGFTFEDVGFRYPESGDGRCAMSASPFARRSASRSSAKTARKTTLTKLIARLLTRPKVAFFGRSRSARIRSRRRAPSDRRDLQDFVRYDMRFDENRSR